MKFIINLIVIINLISLFDCIPSYKDEKSISKWRPYKLCTKKHCPRIFEKTITPHRSVICFPDPVETVTVRFTVNLKKRITQGARTGYRHKRFHVARLANYANKLLRDFTLLNSEIWMKSEYEPIQLLSNFKQRAWEMTLFLPRRKDIFMYSTLKLKYPHCRTRTGGACLDPKQQNPICFDEFRKSNLTKELVYNARIYNVGPNRFWTKNKKFCHCTKEMEGE